MSEKSIQFIAAFESNLQKVCSVEFRTKQKDTMIILTKNKTKYLIYILF